MSIRLSDERCEEIKQEVVNLFERYNINCVPISGFEIASKMGIKVMPYSSKAGEAKKLCLKVKMGFRLEEEVSGIFSIMMINNLVELIIQCFMR